MAKTKRKAARKLAPRQAVPKKQAKARKAFTKEKTPPRTKQKPKKTIGTCFVMMPFKEPFGAYYSSIVCPAVAKASFEPLRGDSLFRPSPIMADIWKLIQDAKVLLADLTEKNANVFYELGLAHAVGKPVVLIAETMDDVPFDLQPLRIILYDKDHPSWGNKLKRDIVSSLKETTADPAMAVPDMFRRIVPSKAPTESKTDARLASLERRMSMIPQPKFNLDLPMRAQFEEHFAKDQRRRDEMFRVIGSAPVAFP